jgi:hypothetical protein
MLRPGGLLILHTPNARCFSFRIMRSHHRYFVPPEHLCFWSREGFGKAASATSLDLIEVQEMEGDHQFRELLAWLLKAKFLRPSRWDMSHSEAVDHAGLKGHQYPSLFVSAFGTCFERVGANQILCVLRRKANTAHHNAKPAWPSADAFVTEDLCRPVPEERDEIRRRHSVLNHHLSLNNGDSRLMQGNLRS